MIVVEAKAGGRLDNRYPRGSGPHGELMALHAFWRFLILCPWEVA